MLNKRLLRTVPHALGWVWLTVFLRFCALLANICFIFMTGACIRLLCTQNTPLAVTTPAASLWATCRTPLLFMALSVLVSVLCNLFAPRTACNASSLVKRTLRRQIYQKLLTLGAGYQQYAPTAKIVQLAVEGVEQIETWFSLFLPQFFYALLASITTFAFLAVLNLRMALSLLACIPLIPLAMATVQSIAKRLLSRYWAQYANLADSFLENLQGLTTLQIYQADAYKQDAMMAEAETFRRVTMKVLSMQLNSIIIMDIIAYGGAALGIIFAVRGYYDATLPLDSALVCILLSADFFIPLRRLGSAFHTAMNGSTASKNIFELLDTEEGPDGTECVPEPAATTAAAAEPAVAAQTAAVAAQSVAHSPALFSCKALSYAFDGRTVLSVASISIPAGSFTAFVGKSGSGKSTLAKILSGIYRSYSGSAKINGMELKRIQRKKLHEYVTYISHRDWIFAGTVRDTLLEGNEAAPESDLWQALEKVCLADFVRENGGLSMPLTEGGANLSGGQKQRLSLARALLHDSPVYLFDEATSNVDAESEEAIMAVIRSLKGKKTVIMISHRSENCAGADCVYYFENGTVTTSHGGAQ